MGEISGQRNACSILAGKFEEIDYLEDTSVDKVHLCTGTEALYRPYGQ